MSFAESVLSYKWIILFYAALYLIIYLNRKKLEIHIKVFALYKTKIGIKLMERLGKKFGKPIRALGYIGIVAGFLGMALVVGFIFYGLYSLFFIPDSPAVFSPIIPGVKIPGTQFQLPFLEGIIAIFIVAVIHEFGHGVVAKAHKVEIKSTGPFVLGPFFGAFVEPDESSLKRKGSLAQLSIFAAGPFFNFLLVAIAIIILNFALFPGLVMFSPEGVSFSGIAVGSPAAAAGLQKDAVYDTFNGKEVRGVEGLVSVIEGIKPGDSLTIGNEKNQHSLVVGKHPKNESMPYLGVLGIRERYAKESSFAFSAYVFLISLVQLLAMLGLGIGTANLLPIGPIDGGRIALLSFNKVFGDEKGQKVWAKLSIAFLFFILLLMTPILKATFEAIF